jgi:hypothetical protein
MGQPHAALRSVPACLATGAWKSLVAFWRVHVAIDMRTYRPERHYMRGPGPKWHQKHARQANRS